jgi:hypothetical protein
MARQRTRRSWIGALRKLFKYPARRSALGSFRRLRAEQLEDRSLLTVAATSEIQSISLSEYLAEQHSQLGPIAPSFATDSTDLSASQPTLPPYRLLLASYAEGEDDPPPEDPPPEDPPPEDPPPEDPPTEDPVIEDTTVLVDGETITIGGSISDDEGLSNLTLTLDNATGTIEVNEDGTFTILITDPGTDPVITITVTDANGNSSTYLLDNPY